VTIDKNINECIELFSPVEPHKLKLVDVTAASKGQEPAKPQQPTKPVFVKMLPKKIKTKEHGIAK
jgi:hypothetical protein